MKIVTGQKGKKDYKSEIIMVRENLIKTDSSFTSVT